MVIGGGVRCCLSNMILVSIGNQQSLVRIFTIAGAPPQEAKNEADYDGNGEDEKEYFFHIKLRAITKFYNELGYYRDYILENYPYQVWKKGQWYLLVLAILVLFVIILPP